MLHANFLVSLPLPAVFCLFSFFLLFLISVLNLKHKVQDARLGNELICFGISSKLLPDCLANFLWPEVRLFLRFVFLMKPDICAFFFFFSP